jgi:uncharacterized membrane protein YdjX (TVP38/TMEM64 family)
MNDPALDSVPEAADGSSERTGRLRLALAVASIAVGVGMIAVVPGLQHSVSLVLHGNFSGLREYVRGLGLGGLALLLALMLLHALIFYPAEIVTATAGYVYGFLPGLGLVMVGWLISGLLAFLLGRILGRPLLRTLLGSRFTSLESAIQRGGIPLLLAGRLVPIVPFSILGYAAGAARVRVGRFAWTTAVGFFPLTAAVAYLGSRAQTLSANDPVVWIAAVVVVGLLVTGRLVTTRSRTSRPARSTSKSSPASDPKDNPPVTAKATNGTASMNDGAAPLDELR